MLGQLATIRNDAERLRSEEAVRKQTLFMIWTAPVMVLAGRRFWRRRRAA